MNKIHDALTKLHDLFAVHPDATIGSLLGFLGGLGAHEHALPGLEDLPIWLRVLMPLIGSMLPVLGKALLNEIRPASKGVAAGMRAKARMLRDRADKKAHAGDEKSADDLLNTADNLDAAASAIEAAEE